MNKNNKKLLAFTFLYLLITTFIVVFFKLGYFFTMLVYFLSVSIFLTIKTPEIFKKIVSFSLLLSIPVTFVAGYIGTLSNAWIETTIFNFRIFNIIPLESFVFLFLSIYAIIYFYESFIEGQKTNVKISSNYKYLIYILGIMLVIFFLVYFIDKELLIFKYAYLLLDIIFFIIPSILIFYHYPKLFKKGVYFGVFFLIIALVYELAALYTGQWSFTGHYIGWVELFGFGFPFEELLFLVFASPVFIWIYEFFFDDKK